MSNHTTVATRPVAFQGTDEERQANQGSHCYDNDPDGDGRCYDCDCRPSHTAADYPCGASVPREATARAQAQDRDAQAREDDAFYEGYDVGPRLIDVMDSH